MYPIGEPWNNGSSRDPARKDEPEVAKQIDALNQQLMNRLHESGRLFLSNTVLHGKFVLRMAIGNIRTDEKSAREAWGEIVEEGKLESDRKTG